MKTKICKGCSKRRKLDKYTCREITLKSTGEIKKYYPGYCKRCAQDRQNLKRAALGRTDNKVKKNYCSKARQLHRNMKYDNELERIVKSVELLLQDERYVPDGKLQSKLVMATEFLTNRIFNGVDKYNACPMCKKSRLVDTEALILKFEILLQMTTELSEGKTSSFIKELCKEKLREVRAVDEK